MSNNHPFNRALLTALMLMFAFGGLAKKAMAEPVLVQSQSGAKGHAWLFGARGAGLGECWLVVPRHVIVVGQTENPLPFTFTDQSGRSGQSGVPVVVSNIKGGLSATGGQKDLAFARVSIGRQKGDCRSRLGLPGLTYQTVLRKASVLTLKNLLPTSFGIFQARVVRAKIDAAAGGMISFQPLKPTDTNAYLKQGLSGSVAEIEYRGELYPFAMVLQVKREQQLGLALRFDLIRKAFSLLERHGAKTVKTPGKIQKPDFTILSFNARSVQSDNGPASLLDRESCWTITPRVGQQNMSITIQAGKLRNGVKGVSLVQPEKCGTGTANLWIDQRVDSNAQWSRAKNCTTVKSDSNQPGCRLDFWGERQLRITINADTPVSLSLIKAF